MAASRRDARAQRAATGPQTTIWSRETRVFDAAVETVAPLTEALQDAAAPAPMTRASRRNRTTPTPAADSALAGGGLPVVPEAVVEPDPAPAPEISIPTAAIVWAAAAAAVDPKPLVPVEPVFSPAEPFELLEPVAVGPQPSPADELPAEAEPESAGVWFDEAPEAPASDVDEFEAAARLFAFTGETPVQAADAPAAEGGEPETRTRRAPSAGSESHVAKPRRRVRNVGRQLATASFSVGVMGIVGLLTVGMTTPADAVAAVTGAEPTSLVAAMGAENEVDPEDIQAYVAPGDIENAALVREEQYSTVSMGEIAAEEGITNYSNFFVNDPNAAIQWPFAVGVPITYGFGMRSGRMHEGADFVPGQGAEIQSIAEGTVRIATNSGGAYGVTVVIDHVIDGQLVSSRYAHMLYGTLKVSAGQHVTVGTILGQTGNTGRSYGAHTHFEILQGGTTAIDPIAWMRKYAGRYSLDHW